MPKDNKQYVQLISKNAIKQMPMLASAVLYDVMRDYNGLDGEQKKRLLRQMSDLSIIMNAPEITYSTYKELYPNLASRFEEDDGDYMECNKIVVGLSETQKVPSDNYFVNKNSDNSEFYGEAFEEPIAAAVEGMKIVSQHLKEHLKTAKLADYEMKFVQAYMQIIDDYASNEIGHNNTISKNPAFLVNETLLGAVLRMETHNVAYDEKKNDFVLKGDDFKADWKTTVASINDTPILDTILKGKELQDKIMAYDKGDATRDDMIKAYSEYAGVSEKMVTMSKEDFDKIHKLGQLQNNYDNFVEGPRTPHYAMFDAKAKVSLLNAGYTMEDAYELSQFYVIMEEAKRHDALNAPEKRSQKVAAQYEKMAAIWENAVSGQITEETRIQNIEAMHECLGELANDITKGDFKDTQFNIPSTTAEMMRLLEARKNAELSKNDKIALSASRKELYEAIKEVDSSVVRSSEQFRKMKSDLEKLANVNRKEAPAKYEFLKKNAMKSTAEYIKYKSDQLNDPKNAHKRSDYEFSRVKTASAVLDRLKAIDRKDFEISQKKDKRFVVNEEMSYKNARAFIKADAVMYRGREELKKRLSQWKNELINSQGLENKNKNFENSEDMIGSDSYKKMTQSLQACINKLDDPNTTPAELSRAMVEFGMNGRQYYESHKGSLIGPVSRSGETRLDISSEISKEMPEFIALYDNLRIQFAPVKDEKGISYMDKPYGVVSKKGEELLEQHRERIIKDRQIDGDKGYENIREVSTLQRQLKSLMKKKNEFMAVNYKKNHMTDHYIAIKDEMSVSELAANYVAKKYLDKMYKVGAKPSELEEMHNELKSGQYEKEVKELSSNPVFKAVAKEYPGRCFSQWDAIERKANAIQSMCNKNLDDMLNSKADGIFEDHEEYVAAKLGAGDGTGMLPSDAAGNVMANRLIAGKSGRLIAQAMAADSTLKPEAAIDDMVKRSGEYVREMTTKNLKGRGMNPRYFIDQPEYIKGLKKKLVSSGNNKLKANAEAKKQAKRNAARNKKVPAKTGIKK